MDYPGPEVLVTRSPSISSHMKTCPELSLYEAISKTIFFNFVCQIMDFFSSSAISFIFMAGHSFAHAVPIKYIFTIYD